jgi:hypothetical protein
VVCWHRCSAPVAASSILHRAQTQPTSELERRAHDRPGLAALQQIGDKSALDLELGARELIEALEG